MRISKLVSNTLLISAFCVSLTSAFAADDLLAAVRKSDLTTVTRLLTTGADVNVHDDKGMTPLMYAAFLRDFNIAKTLINAGADVAALDKLNRSALWYSSFSSDDETSSYILHKPAVRKIINQGSIDTKKTPIHMAITSIQIKDKTLSLYLKAGANVNLADLFGNTAKSLCKSNEETRVKCHSAGLE